MNVFVITFLVSIKRDLLGDDSLSSFMTYFHDNSSEVWRQSFPQYHTICPPSVITQLFTNHSKYILLQHQKPLTTTQLRNRRKHYLFCLVAICFQAYQEKFFHLLVSRNLFRPLSKSRRFVVSLHHHHSNTSYCVPVQYSTIVHVDNAEPRKLPFIYNSSWKSAK